MEPMEGTPSTDLEVVTGTVVDTVSVVGPSTWSQWVSAWLLGFDSPNSRRAYAVDVTQWSSWLEDHGLPDPFKAQRAHVDAWARAMEAAGRAPATVARKISSVSSLYDYVLTEQEALPKRKRLIRYNPAKSAKRPKIDQDHSDTIALDERQAEDFIRAATLDGIQTQVLAELMLTAGLRSAEVLSIQATDLAMDHGHPTVTVTRKGGKRQRLPLEDAVWEHVHQLLAGRTEGPLFITSAGTPLSYSSVYRRVRRIGKAAGFDEVTASRIAPHGLRASFATILLDNEVALDVVQDFMGHVDPRVTRRYDRGRGRLSRLARASSKMGKKVLPRQEAEGA